MKDLKLPCPVCGRIHNIKSRNAVIKCICGNELILIGGIHGKELIKI